MRIVFEMDQGRQRGGYKMRQINENVLTWFIQMKWGQQIWQENRQISWERETERTDWFYLVYLLNFLGYFTSKFDTNNLSFIKWWQVTIPN